MSNRSNGQGLDDDARIPYFDPLFLSSSSSDVAVSVGDNLAPAAQGVPSANTGGVPLEGVQDLSSHVSVATPTTPSRILGARSSTVQTKQFWEGVVSRIQGDEFAAIVKDRTDSRSPDEEVVIGIDEVSPVDKHLLVPGATFYWFIGSERTPAGQQKNVSLIQFRRLPPWSRRSLNRAADRVKRLLDIIQRGQQ